ncbi:MAG: Nif11-like leader peptide family natural product precursor [Synechococcales bacterium]|nr:Nif11-like leader peptide family natural product precursor [Synechococcales bacterium]
MSVKSATRFLTAAARDQQVRDKFSAVKSPIEFLEVSQQLGYSFTTAELKKVVTLQSRGVIVRRSTGVWPWLRSVSWIERTA